MKRKVFYSFHFDNDVMRVQQIRNMGVIEGNEPVSPNEWEQIRRGNNGSIEKWIDDNMKYKDCVVVLVGKDTANRPWVKYEIEKAWSDKRGLLGIYIHNIKCPRTGISEQGRNPFEQFTLNSNGMLLSQIVECYNPNPFNAYSDIENNIGRLIEEAINIRNRF